MLGWIKPTVLLLALGLSFPMACGPSCPEAKSALPDGETASEDSYRVNQLVSRRKMVMKEGEAKDVARLKLESVMLSVDAYELAIQMQLRLIMLSPQGAKPSDLYKKNTVTINEFRCMIDNLIETKNLEVSKYKASDIREFHTKFKRLFEKEGELPSSAYKKYYEDGIKPAGK